MCPVLTLLSSISFERLSFKLPNMRLKLAYFRDYLEGHDYENEDKVFIFCHYELENIMKEERIYL